MSLTHKIAATDAPKGKGSEAVARAAQIQDITMLNVVEKPPVSKAKSEFQAASPSRKAALWLDDMSKVKGVHSSLVEVTPEIAAVLLERNPANRKIKPAKVQNYAHDMKNGAWKFNGEPIIVANDGLLNDGQHRLAAIVDSQLPQKMLMVFGVERDTRDTLDQGVARTAGDYLSMGGHGNTTRLAATARAVWQWRTYGFVHSMTRFAPTRSELLQTVVENPGIERSLNFVLRPNVNLLGSASAVGFCHFAFSTINKAQADYFMDALIDGANLKAGDPILAVRNRLITDRSILKMAAKVELLFRAWNAHRLGQTRVLYRVSGGELPLLEA